MLAVGMASLVALIVIWIGYPVVVRLMAARSPTRPLHRATVGEGISVILATRAEAPLIEARIADLLATAHPGPLQVVVALDGDASWSHTEHRKATDPSVTVVRGDTPGGKATALNAAVRSAQYETLVFADTAQRFAPDAMSRLETALADPRLGAVSGMLELPGDGGSLNLAERYWSHERRLRAAEARLHSAVGVSGSIYAMRRSLWKPLPAGLILDDLYVPMRLVLEGWRVGFTDEARARDTRRFEAGQEFHRKVRTLTGVLQVCAWLPGVLDPMRNPVWLQFLFHKVLRLLTPYLMLGALVGLGGAAVAAAAGSVARSSLILAAALAATAVLLAPRLRRMLATQIRWGLALQGSAAVATWNGLRGRWDVWR